MQSYRINAVHELRAAHIAALEEIAKEKTIYFSGVDEEFAKNHALLSDAKMSYEGAISALLTLAGSIKDASILFVLDDAEKIGRECTHLEKEHAKLAGRQDYIARTARRIEDILADFGFEKQTITPPEEGSIDYVIYTCRRDDHVEVLADRDLRTKKMGVRLYRIPENEFAKWHEALRAGRKYIVDDADLQLGTAIALEIGGILFSVMQLCAVVYGLDHGILPNEYRPTLFGGSIAFGLITPVLSIIPVFFIRSRVNYLDRTLVAKGKDALLYLTRQEEAVPRYRVVVEQEDATTDDAIEHEHNEVNQPPVYQHKPLI